MPRKCDRCGGKWEIKQSLEKGVKCRQAVFHLTCQQCGNAYQINFCLPGLPWMGSGLRNCLIIKHLPVHLFYFMVSWLNPLTLWKDRSNWGIYILLLRAHLLSFKSFNKTFNGGNPAFSSTELINLRASSTSVSTTGCPAPRDQTSLLLCPSRILCLYMLRVLIDLWFIICSRVELRWRGVEKIYYVLPWGPG